MTATSQQHQAELHKKLWDMANSLRGQMEASEFKNYILGLIFYRFLSEKVEEQAAKLLKNDAGKTYPEFWNEQDEEGKQDIIDYFVGSLGYIIKPEHLFSKLVEDIKTDNFSIVTLQEAINEINASTVGSDTQDSFDHLFDDLDLNSSKLGKAVSDRTELIGKILQHVADIPFKFDDVELDLLGSAYEYLIGKFAQTAGKSAGEFYTPQQVSRILAKIVAGDKKQLKSVYDPTCGSGSLLLRIARETKVLNYYGQELTSTTYNLARMNMMLHGVSHEDFDIRNDNTLTKPQHLDKKFEAIVANPPYSAHWNPSPEMADDPRFSEYGKLAPKNKADFAFVQHMLYHLEDNGTMAVVLPHGVLFRGASERVIRKQLIDKNYLDAVIGLPGNIFFGTPIETCILVFKKCREVEDGILFIDASSEFVTGRNSNSLSESNVTNIVEAFISRKETPKFSRIISVTEIIDNDYNLNIPRYIDTSEKEVRISLSAVADSIAAVNDEIVTAEAHISELMKSLVVNPQKDKEKLQEENSILQSILKRDLLFTDDNGEIYPEWEEIKLGTILSEPKKIAVEDPSKIESLTVKLHGKGIVRTGKFPNKTANARPYYVRDKGELLIGRQNFHNGGMGLVTSDTDGLVASNAISSYCIADLNKYSMEYIYILISRSEFYSKVEHLIGGTGQKELSKSEFSKLKIQVPVLEEQQKIAQFVTALVEQLKLTEKKLTLLKEQKKGYLQGIFG